MANNKIRFQLKNGRRPVSYKVGVKGHMINKKNDNGTVSRKLIQYVPGHDSIYAEDHKGDEKPVTPVFENGVLDVLETNRPLINLLKSLPGFNRDYEILDLDSDANRELERMDKVELALSKINTADGDELMANAIIVLGQDVVGLPENRVKARLKKKAFDSPEMILNKFKDSDYDSKFIASLSILKGVVLVNPARTAVTWPDGKVIVPAAVGQDPIENFYNFLSDNSEASRNTMQILYKKSARQYNKKTVLEVHDVINEKTDNLNDGDGLPLDGDGASDLPDADSLNNQITLEDAQIKYEAVFNKTVPPNKKNDKKWLITKVEEHLSSQE